MIIVSLPDEQGKAILEIIKAKSKVTPEIKDGKIVMHIKIKEESSLSEQTTTENLATNKVFEILQEASAEVIRQEVMSAFNKSIDQKLIFLGLVKCYIKSTAKSGRL